MKKQVFAFYSEKTTRCRIMFACVFVASNLNFRFKKTAEIFICSELNKRRIYLTWKSFGREHGALPLGFQVHFRSAHTWLTFETNSPYCLSSDWDSRGGVEESALRYCSQDRAFCKQSQTVYWIIGTENVRDIAAIPKREAYQNVSVFVYRLLSRHFSWHTHSVKKLAWLIGESKLKERKASLRIRDESFTQTIQLAVSRDQGQGVPRIRQASQNCIFGFQGESSNIFFSELGRFRTKGGIRSTPYMIFFR